MHDLCRYMQKPRQQVRVGESKSVASTYSFPLHLHFSLASTLCSGFGLVMFSRWAHFCSSTSTHVISPFLNRLSPSSPCNQSISCRSSNKVQRLPKAFLIWTHYIILSVEHLGYMIQSVCVVCVCVYLLHYTFVLISLITSISSFLDEKHISIGVLTT